jgi:hypothetical protein
MRKPVGPELHRRGQGLLGVSVTGWSASTLADSLGKWLAVAVLAGAFGLASILTVSAVSRRVRKFDTLKAMGSRRIMGEALVIGAGGGAVGVGIGLGWSSEIISRGSLRGRPPPGRACLSSLQLA